MIEKKMTRTFQMAENDSQSREYQGMVTRLGIAAQAAGVPAWLSSPRWVTTSLAARVAARRDPSLVEDFITEYDVDYAAAEKCDARNSPASCAEKYGTLDAFFTRRLRDPPAVDPAAAVVSPADAKAVLFPDAPSSGVWVKGRRWSVRRLLQVPLEPVGGPLGIFRLRPKDYHRFHSPVGGTVREIRPVRGGYLSVDPRVVRSDRNVLTENARTVVRIQQRGDGPEDAVYVVAVGAAGVGKVVVFARVGDVVRPGDELGTFSFGGSTVVVLLPPGLAWDRPTAEETYVRVGQTLVS
jgi:phosphatidylserine decarboxylase